jgi:cytochrome c oxidase cbb3-type subunit 3
MNKLYLGGIIFTAAMLLFTYVSISGSEGGLNGDIVNILGVAGAVALVLITVFVVIKYVRQMQTDTATGDLMEENWDGVGEYNNELPFGWAVSFFLVTVWGLWYFIAGYPVNAYSQIGEYNEDTAAHNAKYESQYASITGERLVEMGESVFLAECKVCHGLTADGINGKAANLNKRLDEVAVKHAVMYGSNNKLLGMEMPMPDRNGLFNANSGNLISDAEINTVSKYVANGFTGAGADIFAGTCASCHGADGKGMEMVAPNIKEFDNALVINVLNHGKKGAIGAMPAFHNLNAKQKEAVAAYISSISK